MSSAASVRTGLGLNASVVDGSISLMPGCAMAYFNPNYTDADFNNTGGWTSTAANLAASNIALLCTACKPGYKPTYILNNGSNIVTHCTSIDNC